MFLSEAAHIAGVFGVALGRRGRLSIIGFTLESLERDYRKWEG